MANIPLIAVLWPPQLVRRILFYCLGILGVLACDHYLLRFFFLWHMGKVARIYLTWIQTLIIKSSEWFSPMGLSEFGSWLGPKWRLQGWFQVNIRYIYIYVSIHKSKGVYHTHIGAVKKKNNYTCVTYTKMTNKVNAQWNFQSAFCTFWGIPDSISLIRWSLLWRSCCTTTFSFTNGCPKHRL